MSRPEDVIQRTIFQHVRARGAPGTFAGATVALATGLDAAIAQLEAWGLLIGRAT